jgi:hypothetical protein
MKKIVSVLSAVAIALSFSSCRNKDKTDSENTADNWRIVWSFGLVEQAKNGMFITDSYTSLSFLDFSTMEQAQICDDPTCKHKSGSDCTSYGKENHPFLYGDKLYYFDNTDFYETDDGYSMDTQLWQCGVNGADEKQITEFKGLTYESYDRMLICGDTIYMCMDNQPYDKDLNELEPSEEFVSYNLKSGETQNYGEIVKGYGSGSWIYGVWDGKVIFSTSKAKNNKPYLDRVAEYAEENGISEKEAVTSFVDEYDNEYWKFDISAGKVSNNDMNEPMAISEDYYYYADDDNLMYLDSNGNKNTVDGISNISDIQILDGYAYLTNTENQTAYLFDEQSKTVSQLDENYYIFAISDGNAIVQIIDDKSGTSSYEKKALSEMEKETADKTD